MDCQSVCQSRTLSPRNTPVTPADEYQGLAFRRRLRSRQESYATNLLLALLGPEVRSSSYLTGRTPDLPPGPILEPRAAFNELTKCSLYPLVHKGPLEGSCDVHPYIHICIYKINIYIYVYTCTSYCICTNTYLYVYIYICIPLPKPTNQAGRLRLASKGKGQGESGMLGCRVAKVAWFTSCCCRASQEMQAHVGCWSLFC